MSDAPRHPTGDPEPLDVAAPVEVRQAQAERLMRAWKTPTGWRYWSAVNNSEVGLWYTAATLFFMAFAGVLASGPSGRIGVVPSVLVEMRDAIRRAPAIDPPSSITMTGQIGIPLRGRR